MDVRLRFVQDVHRPGWSVAEVCRRYQVSRKTGYKWLDRYAKVGPAGLVDRSHRPYSCPHATPAAVVEQIRGLQRRYRWGARKVRWLLAQRVLVEPDLLVLRARRVHVVAAEYERRGDSASGSVSGTVPTPALSRDAGVDRSELSPRKPTNAATPALSGVCSKTGVAGSIPAGPVRGRWSHNVVA